MVIDFITTAYINIITIDVFYFLFSTLFITAILYVFYKIST